MCIAIPAFSQKNEFGVGLGGFNYAGDLMRGYHFTNIKPGGLVYYKRNFDNIFSFRASLTGGLVSGTDTNPIDAFGAVRQASFQSTIVEVAGILEYNFLDFKTDPHRIRWSPHLFVGLGGFTYFGGDTNSDNGSSPFQISLPFGGGFKYMVNENLVLNFEIGIRALFFDQLDGYSDGDITIKNYQYGNKYDNDWFNFVGISVSYVLWDIPCPYDFY